ncbi:hypothetical protein [Neorhizobium petrolearium]|uniref:hypothetical protein n=1 Tax=Neorhizobium petrolearium TaxID=515361 RepID=UPI003F7DAB24
MPDSIHDRSALSVVESGRTEKSQLAHVDGNPQRSSAQNPSYGIVHAPFGLSVRFRTALVLTPTSADFSETPAAMHATAVQRKIVPLREKMTFIGDNATIAPGVTSVMAAGHTPGHMAFLLDSAGRNLLLTGDTVNHFVASLQKPDWEVSFDMDKGAAASSRKRIFGMLAAEKIPFIGYHMPHPSIGYVEPLGAGFRFVPVSYQFLL